MSQAYCEVAAYLEEHAAQARLNWEAAKQKPWDELSRDICVDHARLMAVAEIAAERIRLLDKLAKLEVADAKTAD